MTGKQLIYLHLLLILIPVTFPVTASSDQRQGTDPATIQSLDVREKQNRTFIFVKISSNLPKKAKFQVRLNGTVRSNVLDRQHVNLTPSQSKTIRLGPYSNLWPGTYRISLEIRSGIQPDSSNKTWEKQVVKTVKTSSSVPDPETQKAQFMRKKEQLVEAYSSWFLEVFTTVQSLQSKRVNREVTGENLRRKKKRLEKQTKEKLQELRDRIGALQQFSGDTNTNENTEEVPTGFPFQTEVKDLQELHQLFKRWTNKKLPTVIQKWKPQDNRYHQMTESEQLARKIASPSTLRKRFLEDLFQVSRRLSDDIKQDFDEFRRKIDQQYRKLVQFTSEALQDQNAPDQSGDQSMEDFQSNIQDFVQASKKQIDRILWLFRDRRRLSHAERKRREQGMALKTSLRKLEERVRKVQSSDTTRDDALQQLLVQSLEIVFGQIGHHLQEATDDMNRSFSRLRTLVSLVKQGSGRQLTDQNLQYIRDQLAEWKSQWRDTLTQHRDTLREIPRIPEEYSIKSREDKRKESTGETKKWEKVEQKISTFSDLSERLHKLINQLQHVHQDISSFFQQPPSTEHQQQFYYQLEQQLDGSVSNLQERIRGIRKQVRQHVPKSRK